MKTVKRVQVRVLVTSIVFGIIFIITACVVSLPPAFYVPVAKYAADNGADVPFSVSVGYSPTIVTCFGGNVTMTNTGNGVFTGSADYTNDLLQSPGTNHVICSASNATGTTVSTVGFIELIPNVKPNLIMLYTGASPAQICGNNGTLTYNVPLVNYATSTYIKGAQYTLTAGQLSLPAGLSINTANGNLVGNTVAGNFTINNLKMTATTVVDQHESARFSIVITSAACP